MTEFKGTSGSWQTAATDDSLILCERQRIASTYPTPDDDWGAANARLIAAAPDLLDIAIRARDQFEFYAKSHEAKGAEEFDPTVQINRYMAAQCEAAIAKALGEGQ